MTTAAGHSDSPSPSGPPEPDVQAVLTRSRDLTDPPMREAVGRLAPAMRDVAAYHLGWVDADGS